MRPLIVAAMLAAGPAAEAQPISESLAECSVIYGVSADLMAERRPENADRLAEAEIVFYRAAIDAARGEGRRDPGGYTDAVLARKLEKWGDMQLVWMATSEEFRDWGDYCRALGKSRGLPGL